MSSLFGFLINNPGHLLTALLVGVISSIVYLATAVYRTRRRLPPGPFPLPLVGNILLFRQQKHFHEIFEEVSRSMKSKIFTMFLGSTPSVVITDPHIGIQMLKKHQFAGRPQLPFIKLLNPENSVDVVFSDFTKEWEVLRKVAHSAVRKYAVSERLPHVVADVVDEVIEVIKQHGLSQPFDISKHIHIMMYNILASSAFNKRYKLDDKNLLKYVDTMDAAQKNNVKVILATSVPLMNYIFRESLKELNDAKNFQWDFCRKEYEEHVLNFNEDNIRDFTDALILAKKEAEEEDKNNKDTVKYLKPQNIQNVVTDLFIAGSETTTHTLRWCFLFMTNYPETQRRMREEINKHIADDDVPNLQHRSNCNYTTAFIAEVLRFRYVVPGGVPHKAMMDTELCGHLIPEGTQVQSSFVHYMHHVETWKDPEIFRPERFLDEKGKFVSKPNQFYIPFSAGRRSCPGEKLALADLFFIVARFLQQTKGFEFVLENGSGSVDLSGNLLDVGGWIPHDFKMILAKNEAAAVSFRD